MSERDRRIEAEAEALIAAFDAHGDEWDWHTVERRSRALREALSTPAPQAGGEVEGALVRFVTDPSMPPDEFEIRTATSRIRVVNVGGTAPSRGGGEDAK